VALTRLAATSVAAALAGAAALGLGCSQALKLAKDDSSVVLSQQTIAAPNPARPGPFAVKTLFYGSGIDKQRPEYRDQVAIKTKTVDASPFASVTGTQATVRKEFWGFDLKKAPINGRVWYPDGPGPFPVALIVHGNHNYREFSDPGYAYLGELLASRGFILASVDENFINGLSGENDARAWLLLKHLEAFRLFNNTAGGPLHRRVDMDRIAVMGHSRGGEAAAHAAAFNRLKYYPDDFKQEFAFGFAIKAVVSIAPVDGQYKPSGQFTPLENVNYLMIHGSHDGDVSTAVGLRQYERLRFTDGRPWFKSVFYMYRANHGQWNTVWGSKDTGPRSGRTLELRALIDGEAQREFARVTIGAFLEATLHGKREYLPLFRDHRTAGAWLPKTMYTTRFMESGYRPLAEFDGDVDLTTGSAPGVTIAGAHLSTWNEQAVPFRGRGGDTQNQNAAWVGWNNRLAGDEPVDDDAKAPLGPAASYAVSVPADLGASWRVGEGSVVYLSLAATSTKPGLRRPPKDPAAAEEDEAAAKKKAASAKGKAAPKPAPKPPPKKPTKDEPDTTPIDLTVELVDAAGRTARLPLSRFGVARKPIESRLYRRAGRDAQRFANLYEIVPQTFVMPIADFVDAAAGFDPRALAQVRLVFDRTEAGTVIVEQIGLSTPADPAFLAAPVTSPTPRAGGRRH
jgi:dienelactone hydrolase